MIGHMSSDRIAILPRPAPWTAWRVYRTGTAVRCVISDERFHTYTEIVDESAEVWDLVSKGNSIDQILSIMEPAGLALPDLEDFFAELLELGLLVRENNDALADVHADTPPVPVPLDEGQNVPLEAEMMKWAIDNGFLWSCHWEITYRCNESCVHCYNPGAAHLEGEKHDRVRDELTTEEATLTLDRLAELGLFRLTISGGEAFLRRDLLDIVAHARALGMSVDIYTNGLVLTEERLDRLCTLWPRSVSVSVYSDVAEEHDAITRVAGSHKRSVDCLRRLHQRGIKTAMKSVLFKSTEGRHGSMKFLAEDLGAALEMETSLINGQDGASTPTSFGVTDPAVLIQLAMTEGSSLYVGGAESNYGRQLKDFEATVCGAGVSFLHLDPEGKILSCPSLPLEYGSVRGVDIRDLWRENQRRKSAPRVEQTRDQQMLVELRGQDLMEAWSAIRLRDYNECGTHDRCAWCQHCPGKAMLAHGDPLAPSVADCRLASARMWAARLLEAGVSAERLLAMRGVYDVTRTATTERSSRASLAQHAASALGHVSSAKSGACGGCGSAASCAGASPISIASDQARDAIGIAGELVGVLAQFERLAADHLLNLIQEAALRGDGPRVSAPHA